jgi:glycosyltransferase involved in cell wall biosynthesis
MKYVSVQILAYNHENCIKRCLISISEQIFSNFEIVVGIDKSSDRTLAIVQDFSKNCIVPIKIIEQEVRVGVFNNFMAINNSCEGKYIAVCDGDDFWTDQYKLVKQFEFMEKHPNLSVSFHDSNLINANGDLIRTLPLEIHKFKKYSHSYLIENESFMPSSSLMFKNHKLGQFYNSFSGLNNIVDLPLIIYLLDLGNIGYMAANMSNYVQASNESAFTSRNTSFKNIEGMNMFKLIDSYTKYDYHDVILKKIYRNLINIFLFEITKGEFSIARTTLKLIESNIYQGKYLRLRIYLRALHISRMGLGIWFSEFLFKIYIRLNILNYE